ncbi:MAG: hypothetical protein ACERKD_23985 [Prolixibacteraceae bacterium]
MSKTRKKKASPQLQKQTEAQNRKKFFQKVKWFLTICGHPELYALLPIRHLNKLFEFRLHPPTLKIIGKLPPGIPDEKTLQKEFYSILQNLELKLPNGNLISYYDYFTIGHSCSLNFTAEWYLKLTCYQIIHKKMAESLELFTEENILEILHDLFTMTNLLFSSLDSGIYLTTLGNKGSDLRPQNGLKFNLTQIHKATPVEIKIGDGYRPVFPIGWVKGEKFKQVSITPQKLHLATKIYRSNVPVFIQSHAIIRMNERLDFAINGFVHLMAFASVSEPVIIRKGRTAYLLEFRINEFKVGYFAADLIGKKLIIRTFLLATQQGTPEEEKFRQITGLTRDDIDFLKMTKISSFAKSGIESNSRLKAIFKEAGLLPLVECANNFYIGNQYTYKVSDLLDNYLNVEPDAPNWEEMAETIEAELEK